MSTVYTPEKSPAERVATEAEANDMQIPDHAIRRFARFILPKIQDDFEGTKKSDESTPG